MSRDSLPSGPRLNLGCGKERLEGWINIDREESLRPDRVLDFRELRRHFDPGSVASIRLIHSLSYLRLWEAREFLRDCYWVMAPGGSLILEFPDLEKCARALLENPDRDPDYLEAVRGIYAFDLGQIRNREPYHPYSFGWSAGYLTRELKGVGFFDVSTLPPETHAQMNWRDSRVEAFK